MVGHGFLNRREKLCRMFRHSIGRYKPMGSTFNFFNYREYFLPRRKLYTA